MTDRAFGEDQTQEVLLDLCSELAAPISRPVEPGARTAGNEALARQMDVIREDRRTETKTGVANNNFRDQDVLMVCNRVVKENIGDMMDAFSSFASTLLAASFLCHTALPRLFRWARKSATFAPSRNFAA